MIVAMGIRDTGKKDVLAFVQSASENHIPICDMLREILRRGFKYDKGLLVIIDGSKGIRKAVEVVFGSNVLVQRCQWHKRENVLSYLNEESKNEMKVRINGAYAQNDYIRAKQELLEIIEDLKPINIHAANSMLEGLEETLTLHKIKMNGRFGKTFSTTNCIESLNSVIRKKINKITYWTNSSQRHRWLAASVMVAEKRMKKIKNFKQIKLLKEAVSSHVLKNKSTTRSRSSRFIEPKISTRKRT